MNEIDKIISTIQDYFLGMYEGDMDRLRCAFVPEAQIIGYFAGNLGFMSRDQFVSFAEGSPVPKDSGEAFDMKIVSMDITETIAFVKVEDLYQGLRFTDYLSLLKIDNRWLIVNKAFHHR